jgi:outer membrane protein
MKLLHLFCRSRTIRNAIVIGPIAGGLLLTSAGCAAWLGRSWSESPHHSELQEPSRFEATAAFQKPLREPDSVPTFESGNPLRPRPRVKPAVEPLPTIAEESSESNVQPVGRAALDRESQAATFAGWQTPVEPTFPVQNEVDLARQSVRFAPSFLEHLPAFVEATPNPASAHSDQLLLWGESGAKLTAGAPVSAEIAGQYFSRSLFQHHRTVQPLALVADSTHIPVQPVVGSVPSGRLTPSSDSAPVSVPDRDSVPKSDRAPPPLVIATQESVFQQSNSELPEWWLARVADVQRNQAVLRHVGLSDLIDQAIAQSPKIRMLQRRPALAETDTERERSIFDPVLRLDTRYRDDADPVANQLQTGGPPVLKDNTWSATAGVQRRFETGTTADLFQRLGFKNSNSLFFSPQDQGTATVGLDINHPLLRNSGREFNRSLIVLAELQGQVSFYEYQADLQREMIEIGNLYWQLLHARQIVLQTERSRDRAKQILDILNARADYDASANQVSAAKSDVSQRETELLDSRRSLREIEILLRDKINDADFASDQDVELIPAEFFEEVFPQQFVALHDAIDRALANRWELHRENSRTQAADRQLFMSRCGLAPKLDLVLGVYSSGLAGDSGVEQAWSNQFGSATPGYYGGVEFEVPYGRRQAKSAVQRDQLQKQQALDAYQVARNEVIAQVKTAHVRVETAVQARVAAAQSVLDMRSALQHMQQRWEAAALVEGHATQGTSPSLALEQLLTGQRRLQEAENRLASADLQLALTRQALLLAMGEVLQTHVATAAPEELLMNELPSR